MRHSFSWSEAHRAPTQGILRWAANPFVVLLAMVGPMPEALAYWCRPTPVPDTPFGAGPSGEGESRATGCGCWTRTSKGQFCILPFLILAPFLVSACAKPTGVPEWFDSIQRIPIQTVRVEGHQIAYLDVGQGQPVILVHGLGGSMWQWEYQQIPLASAHRVITLDFLGSGLSDKPDIEYRSDQLLEFFRAFMDALDIERAHMVGNSLGAAVVMGMALSHPERVDRLVLISGMPKNVREKLKSRYVQRALDTRLPAWLVSIGNWLAGRGVTKSVLEEVVYDQSRLTPVVLERAYQNRRHAGFIAPLLAMTKNVNEWEKDFAPRLHTIKHETLVLWGAEDEIFPATVAEDVHEAIPGSTLVIIPESGHMPQWERPEQVNPLLLDFLAP